MSRQAIWILVAVVVIVIVVILAMRYQANDQPSPAGQPSPHAIDQSK
jgi:hypothetical protein